MRNFLVVIFIFCSSFLQAQDEFSLSYLLNTQAEDFELKTTKGKKHTLSKMKGKIVVLNFWFMGCMPCVREFPDLNEVVEKYKGNKDVVFLGISVDGKAENIKIFLKRKEFKYEIVITDFTLAKKQGVQLYPTNIVIDKTGKITFASAGYKDNITQELTQEIEKALK